MASSPRLSLSYLSASQAQKHVTVNETFRRLDALVQLAVESRTTAAEPASPADGDAYILPASPTGANWAAMSEGSLAVWQDGAWVEIVPKEGWRAWVADDDEFVVYDGAAWGVLSGGSSETAEKFGINTTADTTNRLAVKADAALFSHDDVTPGTGSCQVKVNKDAAGDTASFLFQTGFSGRAEFGIVGDDNFRIAVSPNGSTWRDAIVIDRNSGDSSFQRDVSIARAIPSDFWGTSSDQSSLWLPYGYFGTNGAFGLGLWWNGYRNNAAGWTSQSINGSSAGGAFEIQSGACYIRHQDPVTGLFPAIVLSARAAAVEPGSDNAVFLGTASRRWKEVYAVSGTINTSDARLKDVAGGPDAAEMRAARRVLDGVVKYRWKDAVAEKGDGARLHFGFTSQAVREAFAAEGLDAARYGLWCEDEIVETVDDPEKGVFERPTGQTRQGLRHEELTALLIAALVEQIEALSRRVQALEKEKRP